jgi:hypothetical protein
MNNASVSEKPAERNAAATDLQTLYNELDPSMNSIPTSQQSKIHPR